MSDWDVSGDGKYAMMRNKLDYEVFDLTSSSSQLKSSIANDKSQVSWAEFASSSGSSIIFKRERGGLVYKQSIRGEEIVLSKSKFVAIAPDVIRKYVFDDKGKCFFFLIFKNDNNLKFQIFKKFKILRGPKKSKNFENTAKKPPHGGVLIKVQSLLLSLTCQKFRRRLFQILSAAKMAKKKFSIQKSEMNCQKQF